MHPQVQAYINRIYANDLTLIEINLYDLNLTDADITPLMEVLASNPGVAQRITMLGLGYNQLTAINIPAQLTELLWLQLSNNPLTIATKIALDAEILLRYNDLRLDYNDHLPNDTALTVEILNEHFTPMFQVNPDEAIGYLKNLLKIIGATQLVRMPTEHLTLLNEMLPTPEIARAQASMNNFQSIFSRLAELNNDESQLNTLNVYNDARFKPLVETTEDSYRKLFNSLKHVISARGAINRDNSAILNQPAANTPILFSATSPTTKEQRNDTYCGFNLGFLLNRKSGLFN